MTSSSSGLQLIDVRPLSTLPTHSNCGTWSQIFCDITHSFVLYPHLKSKPEHIFILQAALWRNEDRTKCPHFPVLLELLTWHVLRLKRTTSPPAVAKHADSSSARSCSPTTTPLPSSGRKPSAVSEASLTTCRRRWRKVKDEWIKLNEGTELVCF